MSELDALPELAALPERFPIRRKYLIAVSGGRDSVALLDALVAMGYRRLIICHLNHRLRGRDSTADARFVAELGKCYQLTVDSASEDVGRLAKREQSSLETAARLARHRFFFSAAARHRCRQIFLAHHADDQVESVLMHLFRGSGLGGITGMRERTTMSPPPGSSARSPITLLRPMLRIWRSQIDTYIDVRALSWREDTSNVSTEHLRNRVRSTLIPKLREIFQRDVSPMVHRLAKIVTDDHDHLSSLADQALNELTIEREQLSASKLRRLHPALQRRVIQKWLATQRIGGIGFNEIESTLSLLTSDHPSKINLPNGRHVRRRAGLLFVE